MMCVLDKVVALYQTLDSLKKKEGIHRRTYQRCGDAPLGLWGGLYALRRQLKSWRGGEAELCSKNGVRKPKTENRKPKTEKI